MSTVRGRERADEEAVRANQGVDAQGVLGGIGIRWQLGMVEESGQAVPVIDEVVSTVTHLVGGKITSGDALGLGLDLFHDRSGTRSADGASSVEDLRWWPVGGLGFEPGTLAREDDDALRIRVLRVAFEPVSKGPAGVCVAEREALAQAEREPTGPRVGDEPTGKLRRNQFLGACMALILGDVVGGLRSIQNGPQVHTRTGTLSLQALPGGIRVHDPAGEHLGETFALDEPLDRRVGQIFTGHDLLWHQAQQELS